MIVCLLFVENFFAYCRRKLYISRNALFSNAKSSLTSCFSISLPLVALRSILLCSKRVFPWKRLS